jgi:CHAT domain-containing protein
VYNALGQNAQALENDQLALATYKDLKLPQDVARIQGNIGNVYNDLGQNALALENYQLALATYKDLKLPQKVALVQGNIGTVYNALGQNALALENYQLALATYKDLKLPQDVARMQGNIGSVYSALGQNAQALSFFGSAIPAFRLAGDRVSESWILYETGRVLAAMGNRKMATVAYKLSVGLIQSLRGDIKTLDKDIQKSFKAKNASRYRELADLLIDEGRFTEAQRILDLLKDDELNQFARAGLGHAVDLTKREAAWKAKYDDMGSSMAADQAERDSIAKEIEESGNATPAQKARLDAADAKIARHEDRVKAWLDGAKLAFADQGVRADPIEAIQQSRSDLSTTLASMPTKTAAVYTVATADGVRTLLTLPGVTDLKAGPNQKIASADLNKKIAKFRDALTHPQYDPRPLGAELYDILIRPIEKELKDTHTQCVVWSLDGPLRYLPLAALYDSQTKQYLIEKYPTSLFVPALRSRLADAAKPITKAYGFGLTQKATVRDLQFSALPGVKGELDKLHNSFDAKVLLDADFTATTFTARLLGKPNIVHLGTHFQLRPGNAEASFLVLGDKTAFSANQFYELSKTKALSGVDLLVLSACDTATPIDNDADGAETESFARIAMEGGASAVLATLWPVNDTSTSMLMGKFYALRKSNPALGKLEALRQAQMWLMTTDGKNTGLHRASEATDSKGGLPAFKPDPKHPFAHPYYWAPFVLTGNTR